MTYNISSFGNKIVGNWYGSLGTFSFPSNSFIGNRNEIYTNFKATYSFEAYVSTPDSSLNFNTTGTYCHSKASVSVTPNVSFDPTKNGGVTAGIGIGFGLTYDIILTEQTIRYNPN